MPVDGWVRDVEKKCHMFSFKTNESCASHRAKFHVDSSSVYSPICDVCLPTPKNTKY